MAEVLAESQHSLTSLLCIEERDFLIKNNGEKVAVSELVGKTVCLYFSAHWCPPCRRFTPHLVEFYNELKKRGEDLEIVFVSSDREEESFVEYFGSMPWLALPFRDPLVENMSRYFEIEGIPTLIVLGPDGKTLQTKAVEMVGEYGVQVYPFTAEKLDELKAEEEARRAAQTIESLLVADERDFVIKHGGGKVPVSDLEGKTVGLYFSAHWCPPCRAFTPMLAKVYEILKEKGEAFEIVFLSSDENREAFEEYYASMPWLALPFGDETKKDLSRHFHVKGIPYLVIIGPDGKTVRTDGRKIISAHGAKAYPFTDARLVEVQKEMEELKAEEESRRAAQTIESLLVSDERDFVIKLGGGKVPVSDLKGKTVGLYFSAHWCPPCRAFTPVLTKVYEILKEKGEAFEIVFLSSDKDQEAFEEYYASMPWLALPFGDKTKKDLSRYFNVKGIPYLVIIGPDGKTVRTDGRNIITVHEVKAYPFTDARVVEMQKEMEELKAEEETWRAYPGSAIKNEHSDKNEKQQQESKASCTEVKPAGVVCEGDVCRKV